MPYRAVLTIACLVLALRYLFDPTAVRWHRLMVVLVTVASFALPAGLGWQLTSMVAQLGVSLFVLLRLAAHRPSAQGPISTA
jgi:hypothetical protein